VKKALPPRTRFSGKLTLVICGLCLCLIVLEIALRVSGFVLVSLQEHRNRLALQKKGAFRILCLGESTTRNQYPAFLAEALNKRSRGLTFTVIDQGLAGATTASILSRLEQNLDIYRPDMVVAMMGVNDRGKHMPYAASIPSPAALSFLRSLKTYKLISLLRLRLITAFRHPDTPEGSLSQEGELKRCIARNPCDTSCYDKLGKAYAAEGKFLQAENVFAACIASNPRGAACYAGLGGVYREQKKFPQAEEVLKKGIALEPRDTACYRELGATHRRQRAFSQAEQAFAKAVELDPHDSVSYADLAGVCGEQGNLSRAQDVLAECIKLNPNDPPCYILLAGVYRRWERLPEAEALLKKAIALSRENDIPYGKLAVIYEEAGDRAMAEECYRQANALREKTYNPDTIRNYRRLKAALSARGIRLVCVQYPIRGLDPLKKIFSGDTQGLIFVDNEHIFKEAVKQDGYKSYFIDMFGGDFGHCTEKGNRLLAENIADTIMREAFGK